MDRNPILCAIDTPDLARAQSLIAATAGAVGGVKLGLEFFVAHGPDGIRKAAAGQTNVFLDLKLHDIPNTVAGAVKSVLPLDPLLLTIHCGGGPAMMRAAVEARGGARAKIVGVTVLTSLDDNDLTAVGQSKPAADQVKRLALLAQESGLDGVVCSPQEVAMLRGACRKDFLLVVPGIRPAGAAIGDQKRVQTPRDAIAAGADYLVIGRPITEAADPGAAARAIAAEMP
ncbi:MAG TPA: orotidine-5'-phosphate decarboxylase [Stellaceae bacterium]|jgi:orotidine-5'-phosphate decarboxylase|nr:orotidine-5'-phosphate decarboxylase [Stellaceae bacterium]